MLFTPLLPKAGPTGGLGLAWPAPTISLTIWSVWIAFLAIAYYLLSLVEMTLMVERDCWSVVSRPASPAKV